ncbi:MAG: type II toxin-antitoxin system PemK/MazF family toxin [Deltaproteobacteria bacterium]|nr:type II toxin-antitoxin system PemK/MazF family toxin [Deltaproteobacteria bacterium]
MAYTRGDIVLLPFPYTDKSTRKVRPAVVVSEPAYEADTGERNSEFGFRNYPTAPRSSA